MRAHIVHPGFRFAGLAQLADPRLTLASLVPFCAGAVIAFDQRGSIDAGLALWAYVAIFLIEIGKNALNNLYIRPRPGHPQLLPDEDLINIGWIAFMGAAVIGTFVASESTPALLLLGAFAAAVAAAYAIPPIALAKHGLGEAAIAVVYGPGIVIGTLLVLRGTLTAEAIVVAITLGLLMAATSATNRGHVRTLLYVVAFAVPLVWAVYVGPFRLTAAFAGIPVAMLTSERDVDDVWPLATFALTGVALSAAIAWL